MLVPMKQRLSHLSTVLVLAVCLGVVAAQLSPSVSRRYRQWSVSQLASQAETASDQQARILVRQMAEFGEEAIPSLVAAAASRRMAVAEQAQRLLDQRLATWQIAAANQEDFALEDRLLVLARALADEIDQFGPAGKGWAEHLGTRLVELSAQLPAREAPRLLEACSTIFENVVPEGPRLQSLYSWSETLGFEPNTPLDKPPIDLRALRSELELPSQGESTKPLPPATPEPIVEAKPFDKELRTVSRGDRQSSGPAEALSAPPSLYNDLRAMKLDSVGSTTSAEIEVVDLPPPTELSSQTPIDELPLLDREQPGGRLQALLHSSNVEDRLEAIEQLVELPAGQARYWLRQLLSDSSPRVRLEALLGLTIARDPQVVPLAREMAIYDEDPSVADVASQILRQLK